MLRIPFCVVIQTNFRMRYRCAHIFLGWIWKCMYFIAIDTTQSSSGEKPDEWRKKVIESMKTRCGKKKLQRESVREINSCKMHIKSKTKQKIINNISDVCGMTRQRNTAFSSCRLYIEMFNATKSIPRISCTIQTIPRKRTKMIQYNMCTTWFRLGLGIAKPTAQKSKLFSSNKEERKMYYARAVRINNERNFKRNE